MTNYVSLQKKYKRKEMDTLLFGIGLIIRDLTRFFAGMCVVCACYLSVFLKKNNIFSPQTPFLARERNVWFLCKTNLGNFASAIRVFPWRLAKRQAIGMRGKTRS